MKYQITGAPMPVVTCELEANESMFNESGSMCWMTPNMEMTTTSNGGVGKVLSRLISGEKLFQNIYTAKNCAGKISFASSFPGDIVAVEVGPGREFIMQKGSFLAATRGVELSVHLQKKFGTGFFGGEGFIMQKISGSGIAFIEIDGSASEYMLQAGESIIVDTGYLVMAEASCSIDIQTIKGAKNIFFGGEGVFNTVVTGPGKIVLQSMPISKTAMAIYPYLPQPSSNS